MTVKMYCDIFTCLNLETRPCPFLNEIKEKEREKRENKFFFIT